MRILSKMVIPAVALMGAMSALAGVVDDGVQNFTGGGTVSTALTFAPFNPALGTLISVEVLPVGSSSGQLTVTNDNTSGPAETFGYKVDTGLSIMGGGIMLSLDPFFGGHLSVSPQQTVTSGLVQGKTVTDPMTFTSGLSAFESGPIVFDITGSGVVATKGGTDLTINATSSVMGSLDVIYNYASTPEPGTAAMVGGALFGIGLLGRKLRRQ